MPSRNDRKDLNALFTYKRWKRKKTHRLYKEEACVFHELCRIVCYSHGCGPYVFSTVLFQTSVLYCTTPLGHYYTVTPSFFFSFFSLTKLNFCVFFIFLYQLFFLFCFHFTNVLVFLASPFFFSPRFLHLFDFFLFFPLTFSPAKWITN